MRWPVLWGLLFLLLGACGGSAGECDQDTPCGFGEMCVDNQCVTNRCATSAQCPMEHYCMHGECLAGCNEHHDCYPGSLCDFDVGSCAEQGCEETWVDCAFREFCDTETGECFDAGDLYCRLCGDHQDCGEGNYCFFGYCGVNCTGGKECPAGFECMPVTDGHGNVITYQCLTICGYYEEYRPGEFAVGSPTVDLDELGFSPMVLEVEP